MYTYIYTHIEDSGILRRGRIHRTPIVELFCALYTNYDPTCASNISLGHCADSDGDLLDVKLPGVRPLKPPGE